MMQIVENWMEALPTRKRLKELKLVLKMNSVLDESQFEFRIIIVIMTDVEERKLWHRKRTFWCILENRKHGF